MGSLGRQIRANRFITAFGEHFQTLRGVLQPGKAYTFKGYSLTMGKHGEDVFVASVFEDDDKNVVVCQSMEFGCVFDPEWMDRGDLTEVLAGLLEMDEARVEAILESADLL